MNIKKIVLAAALPLAMMMAAPAQAMEIMIDDWNIGNPDGTQEALDNSTGDGGEVTNRTNTGGVYWGTRGQLYANLDAGDEVTTVDCFNCQQGHGTNDSNSTGNGYWSWEGAATDMSGSVSVFYDADIAGGDLLATFMGDTTQQIWWSDINAGPLTLGGSVAVANVTKVVLDWVSVGGVYDATADTVYNGGLTGAENFGIAAPRLDFNVENARVPEPATIALMGLGLAGLASRRRKSKAV